MTIIVKRIAIACMASAQLGVGIALLDALLAKARGGSQGDLLLLPIYSLISVYAVPIALAAACVSWVLGGARALATRLGAESVWLWPCCALAWLMWLVVGAQLSVSVLASDRSANAAGALMTLGVLLLAGLLLGAAVAAAQGLQRHLGDRLTVGAGSLVAVAIAGLGLALLIMIGETSGAGGALRLFGVMKRQELDLRAVGLVLLWGTGILAVIEFRLERGLSGWRTALGVGAVLVVAMFGYGRWNDAVAFSVRSAAPLSGKLLGAVWQATDRDHDGQSALFAGGDCDDGNPQRYAGAQDVPGNGIDEDCTGSDEVAPAQQPLAQAQTTQPAAGQNALRKDLNLLLLTVDTMRFDLGYMGNPHPLSKNMDQLASRSVVFERAYSVASYTGKAIGPILIGRYPGENHRTFAHFDRFSTENVFLQERLQKAGLRTVSVQGYWYFVEEQSGLVRGFDVVDQTAKPPTVKIEGDATVNSDKISDAALKQLQAVQDQRFFMWVHYVDPHADYVPHEGFDFGSKGRERYDGEIAFVDQQLGRLLDFVQQGPLKDNTIIIVSSDHGEAFGEHGLYRHGFEVWEELIRVPLIVHVPGIAPKREPARRSLIDLAPTILEMLGVQLPAEGAKDVLSGYSLLPDLVRPASQPSPARPIFADLCAGPFNDERQALIEDDMKIITAMGRPVGVYDLAKDPGEKDNLLNDAQRAAAMKAKLASFRAKLKRVPVTR